MSDYLTLSSDLEFLQIKLSINFFAACATGYFGPHCINRCPLGLFGDECAGSCYPHCSNITCHHVYGCLERTTEKSQAKASGKVSSYNFLLIK